MESKYVRIGMDVSYKKLKHVVTRKADNGSYMLSVGDSFTYAFADEFEPFIEPTTFQRRTEEINEILKKESEMVKKEQEKKIHFPHPSAVTVEEINKQANKAPKHYDNDNGSLYMFSEHQELNAWEFDCIKRLVRCRRKGEFVSDIKKTIHVLELYLKEQGHLYENETKK